MRRRIVIGLLLAVAAGMYVWVFTGPTDDGSDDLPPAVQAVLPRGGSLELRQTTIVADLAPGFAGYLVVDGNVVPRDEVREVPALNRYEFSPGGSGDFAELRGPTCATVVYYRVGQSPDDPSGSHTWCFDLT